MFHASSTAQYITIFFKPKKMFENGFKVKLLFVLTTSMSGSTEKNKMHLYEKVSDDLLEFDLLDDYIDPEITPFEKLSKKAKKGIMIDRLEKFVLEPKTLRIGFLPEDPLNFEEIAMLALLNPGQLQQKSNFSLQSAPE